MPGSGIVWVEQATDGIKEDDMSRPYYLSTQP